MPNSIFILHHYPEVYLEQSRTSTMEFFTIIVNGQKLLTIFVKSYIVDIRLGSHNVSAIVLYKVVPNRLSVAPKINSDYHKKLPQTTKYMVNLNWRCLGLKQQMVYNIPSWVVDNYSFKVSDLKNIWIHVYNKLASINKLLIVNYQI